MSEFIKVENYGEVEGCKDLWIGTTSLGERVKISPQRGAAEFERLAKLEKGIAHE